MPRPEGMDIVIPCHNAAGTIERTLEALELSSAAPDQVICVDDGSRDDTWAVLARRMRLSSLQLRPIRRGTQAGAASARNAGAAASTAEFIVFLDADVVVMPDTLAELRRKLNAGPWVAAVAMYADHSARSGPLAQFQAYLAHFVFSRIDAADSPYLGTQCVMIRRDVFCAAGGFDESYGAATVEDFELGIRLRRAGHRICLVTAAVILHNHSYSIRSFARNYYVKARDMMDLLRSAGRDSMRAGGYFDPSNAAAVAMIGMVMAGAVLAIALDPWFSALAALATICLVIAWRDFLVPVTRARGLETGIGYFCLRSAVVLLGAAGVLSSIKHRSRK